MSQQLYRKSSTQSPSPNSHRSQHVGPVFSFTLGLKNKVKGKDKAGSSCFRLSPPGWGGLWGLQAKLASPGGETFPTFVLEAWVGRGEVRAPPPQKRRQAADRRWHSGLLSLGDGQSDGFPGEISLTWVWLQVKSYYLLNSRPSGAGLIWSWACVGLGKKSWPPELYFHRIVPFSLKVHHA